MTLLRQTTAMEFPHLVFQGIATTFDKLGRAARDTAGAFTALAASLESTVVFYDRRQARRFARKTGRRFAASRNQSRTAYVFTPRTPSTSPV